MLTADERAQLQSFVDKSPDGAPYLRRARILLLADEGLDAETITAAVGVPIVQTRNLLRAHSRQGLAMFPPEIFREPPPFGPDAPVAEAARLLMARELATILAHAGHIRETADPIAVHETRKAIRRLTTCFKLFPPYFETNLLRRHRRRFRRIMRRLGRSRDTAVFLEGLARYRQETDLAAEDRQRLQALEDDWQARRQEFDAALQEYLSRDRVAAFLADFGRFTATAGDGVAAPRNPFRPVQVRHVAPVLIYRRLARLRAYDGRLAVASLVQLHSLRIQGKELRYTLEFFQPVLGPTAAEALTPLLQLQDYLGQLNDARVALLLLDQTPAELEAATALYRDSRQAEARWLADNLPGLWAEIEQQSWRHSLAAAVAPL